ncbi:MAG TPA: SRPBCC family protein [Polyangia bacterium]|nr:SRPBCC family protein [Polyangia bacterium]
MRHTLSREQLVPAPRADVFAFFADAGNLQRLTPPALEFSILTPLPITMRPGTIIDYRLSLFRIPFRWRTVIEAFEPESRFVDVQAAGPYRAWRHTHELCDAPGGTLVRDRVEYELPLGPVGDLAHALFVRRQLDRIFDYRRRVIEDVFATSGQSAKRGR